MDEKYPLKMLQNRWQELFDPQKTGIITLSKFCDVLGLELETLRFKYVVQEELKVETDLHSSLENVHEFRKNGQTNNHVNNINNANNELVKWIKLRLDKHYKRLWHCVIVRGQYSSFYSYQPGYSFCFRHGPRVFLLFKTPNT
ncbi:unnamed protein product [Schistosoma margrebowiei]|uniref:Uncharacterized protein n=1 Tax=Schistosoma margrebowiei TaxID=48269 RepID=A0A183MW13_9TREM|nr:unnamed protein product [Schistosoma margrebowiei]